MWGDDGYFKLARKGNDCGITIGGVLAIVDEEAATKAATPQVSETIEQHNHNVSSFWLLYHG
jgi:hypothetical protein